MGERLPMESNLQPHGALASDASLANGRPAIPSYSHFQCGTVIIEDGAIAGGENKLTSNCVALRNLEVSGSATRFANLIRHKTPLSIVGQSQLILLT
jgi:hypothetical protein